MKNKLSKRMGLISAFVIFFGVFNILSFLIYAANNLGIGNVSPKVMWEDDILAFQIFLFAGRAIFGVAINVLAIIFMLSSIRLMQSGLFFSKRNAAMLWWAAPLSFLYSFCAGNMNNVYGMRNIFLTADSVFVLLLILGFAMIYNAGLRLSEENSLTI